jgi:hypothetical protein
MQAHSDLCALSDTSRGSRHLISGESSTACTYTEARVHELLQPAVLSATNIRQRQCPPHGSYRLDLLRTQHFLALVTRCEGNLDALCVAHIDSNSCEVK